MGSTRGFVRTLAVAAAAAGLVAVGSAPPFRVVATVVPVGMIVEAVGGERVAVRTLVPPGASPHVFEPRPADLARLAEAQLFAWVGPDFDGWARDLAHAAPDVPQHALLGEGADPHLWLDPIAVRDAIAPSLARALAAADPAGADVYRAGLADFQERLGALDADIRAMLSDVPDRRYVAFHNAWRAFADRYGLEELGVVEEFAGAQPGPRALARLVERARAAGIGAILVEPQLPERAAAVLAAEFGGRLVRVDPLGDPSDPARADYEALMRDNARAFRDALGGAPR